MKIVFYSPVNNPRPWLDSLAAGMPGAEVWAWTPECANRQADYAVLWAPPLELFKSQHQLKAVFNIGAGVDRILMCPDIYRLLNGAIIVRLNDAGMAVQMAEYVCHALFRHAREFAEYERQQRNCKWKPLAGIDRAAWPVGVMGLGAMGERAARSIAAFEYPVFGWSRTPRSLAGIRSFAGPEGLDEFLSNSRVLVCALPLTPATVGIVNARALGMLKPHGYLINVARGAHLVEADLIELLDGNQMAGATLDVFDDEPLPVGHPFWNHPKVTVTPHIAAVTLREPSVQQIVSKINSIKLSLPVEGIVFPDKGY